MEKLCLARLQGDAFDCAVDLDDETRLLEILRLAARECGMKVVGQAVQRYEPQGRTCVLFLAESHLLLSTWPERRYAQFEASLRTGPQTGELAWACVVRGLGAGRQVLHQTRMSLP